jgi:hypothetical protein
MPQGQPGAPLMVTGDKTAAGIGDRTMQLQVGFVPAMFRPMAEFDLPLCRFCRRPWQPDEGVSARVGYCRSCVDDRRAIAADVLGWGSPTANAQGYLLPSRTG